MTSDKSVDETRDTESSDDETSAETTSFDGSTIVGSRVQHEKAIEKDVALMHKVERSVEGLAPIGLGLVLTSFLLVFHDNGIFLGYGANDIFTINVVISALVMSAVLWAIALILEKGSIKLNRKFLVLTSGFFWISSTLGMMFIAGSDYDISGIALMYGILLGIALTTAMIACAKYYSTLPLAKTVRFAAASFLLAVALSSLAIYTTQATGYYVFGIIVAVAGLFILYRKLKDVSLEKWKHATDKQAKIRVSLKGLWPLIAACALTEFLIGLSWNANAGGLPHDVPALVIGAAVAAAVLIIALFVARRSENTLRIYQCIIPTISALCILAAYALLAFTELPGAVLFGLLAAGFIGVEISVWITLSSVSKVLSMPASILFGVRGLAGSICCALGVFLGSFVFTADTLFIGIGTAVAILAFSIAEAKGTNQ